MRDLAEGWRDRAEGMEPSEAVEYLMGVCEALEDAMKSKRARWPFRLTQQQARLIDALKGANGGLVTKEALLAAMNYDRHYDEWAEPKLVDVTVCKIRKKLPAHIGRIETIWGQGYRFLEPDQ